MDCRHRLWRGLTAFAGMTTVETDKNLVLPKSDSWKMFNSIAGRYDFLNRLLSLGQDLRWRKALKQFLAETEQQTILDLATGTADVLTTLAQDNPRIHRG